MTPFPPDVALTLQSNPENLVVVRQALGGVAEALGLSAFESNDMYTAVTEACNNVVAHAYGEAPGPMRVEVASEPGALWVSVRDWGIGLAGPPPEDGSGLGLRLIEAIAEDLVVGPHPHGGTEIEMRLGITSAVRTQSPRVGFQSPDPELVDARSTLIELAQPTYAGPVLPRALAAVASGASFPAAALRDVELLGRRLAARAHEDQPLAVAASRLKGRLELVLEPFPEERELSASLGTLAGETQLLLAIDPQTTSGRLALSVMATPAI